MVWDVFEFMVKGEFIGRSKINVVRENIFFGNFLFDMGGGESENNDVFDSR